MQEEACKNHNQELQIHFRSCGKYVANWIIKLVLFLRLVFIKACSAFRFLLCILPFEQTDRDRPTNFVLRILASSTCSVFTEKWMHMHI